MEDGGFFSRESSSDWPARCPKCDCRFCICTDGRVYKVDGDNFTESYSLADLGDLDDEVRDEILALEVGQEMHGGGGAAAEFTVRRVA